MEFVSGISRKESLGLTELLEESRDGEEVLTEGMIHSIRDMGEIVFVILRRREGLLQTVYEKAGADGKMQKLKEGDAVRILGILEREPRAVHGTEIRLLNVTVLSSPKEPLPIAIDKWKLNTSLEANLNRRAITLRNVRERAKFRIQEGVCRGFREFLYGQGFTEIHTPKLAARSAEGGSNLFRLQYFHKPAVLAQSPQLYKQMMTGVFDRVFETGPVFRAEKHNTKRHLNEYTSLDFEMAYIDSFLDICGMETAMLRYVMKFLEAGYERELKLLGVTLPNVDRIPIVRFDEAKRLVSERYHRAVRTPYDLEPEEEALIGRYFKEEYDSDFVFVTHYPSKKRPFYAMDDPADPDCSLSFDLLFQGLEITTGGQRIHDYGELLKKMEERGMSEEGMEDYLDVFRYGMPPHGGLGIGLERLTMKILGEDNVREACLFPRDMTRLKP